MAFYLNLQIYSKKAKHIFEQMISVEMETNWENVHLNRKSWPKHLNVSVELVGHTILDIKRVGLECLLSRTMYTQVKQNSFFKSIIVPWILNWISELTEFIYSSKKSTQTAIGICLIGKKRKKINQLKHLCFVSYYDPFTLCIFTKQKKIIWHTMRGDCWNIL